jgi:hypothetical protein
VKLKQQELAGLQNFEWLIRRRTPKVDFLHVLLGGVELEPLVVGDADEEVHSTLPGQQDFSNWRAWDMDGSNRAILVLMPTHKFIAEILNAAIVGFEQQKLRIDAQIAELRQMLHGGPTATAAAPEVPKGKRRKMNAAARKRIGDAQRKRWAESTKESTPPSPVAPEAPKPKRRLSAAGKKAIGDATRKRWARVRAEAVRAAKAQQAPAAKKAVKKAPVKASRKAAKKVAAKRPQKAAATPAVPAATE